MAVGHFLIVMVGIGNMACSVLGVRSEENPIYEVVRQDEDKEIRLYQPYFVAEATVQGEYEQAQSEAFRILAKYIFGGNKRREKVAMTSPVMQEQVASPGEKITMTAPVTQEKSDLGWTIAFMMPSQYKIDDLPVPDDERVRLRQVKSRYMAAIRYTWGRGATRNQEKALELQAWLETQKDYVTTSGPISAGYDPPWTLPFLRRNEMLIELVKVKVD